MVKEKAGEKLGYESIKFHESMKLKKKGGSEFTAPLRIGLFRPDRRRGDALARFGRGLKPVRGTFRILYTV